MIHVETVDLSLLGVRLPKNQVGIVAAQPYLELTNNEPFQCLSTEKGRQLDMLDATLAVALKAPHGASKTHFTLFPEYSIPGHDGIARIETALRAEQWPTGTIVIGGIDAMNRQEFVDLAEAPDTYLDSHNSVDRIAAHEWVNCATTWVKADDKRIHRWLQPKLHPAWREQNIDLQHMFRGNSVFTFKGPFDNGCSRYRFFSLVCFDWIATVHGQKSWQWVLGDLERQAEEFEGELSLSWLFVIECNPKPSHIDFLVQVRDFFDQNHYPNVRRDRACLLFANRAGKPGPGRPERDPYGSTSLVFSRQAQFSDPECAPTFCNGGQRYRSSTALSSHHDLLFRESGACIHSFVQINPGSVPLEPAGRTIALDRAYVHPLDGIPDPRTPGAPVPASTKWLNDELDVLPSLKSEYPAAPLAAEADTTHQTSVSLLRNISLNSARDAVNYAVAKNLEGWESGKDPNAGSKDPNADSWDHLERVALEHLVHTLDIMGIAFPGLTIDAVPPHAVVRIQDELVDLLAIRGAKHEDCIKYAKRRVSSPRRRVLLVSSDLRDTPKLPAFRSILEPNPQPLGEECDITDPDSGHWHLYFADLLTIFRSAPTPDGVRGGIIAKLSA